MILTFDTDLGVEPWFQARILDLSFARLALGEGQTGHKNEVMTCHAVPSSTP